MKTISTCSNPFRLLYHKVIRVFKIIFLPAAIFMMAMMITSIVFSVHALADEWSPACNHSGTIEQLLVDDGGVQVIIRRPPDAPINFDQTIQRAFQLNSSVDNYDVKAAALLSAYFGGHEISIYYHGSLNSWNTNVVRFKVRPVSP
jgi:hypothetical protein